MTRKDYVATAEILRYAQVKKFIKENQNINGVLT